MPRTIIICSFLMITACSSSDSVVTNDSIPAVLHEGGGLPGRPPRGVSGTALRLIFVKWLLAIPHIMILWFLQGGWGPAG